MSHVAELWKEAAAQLRKITELIEEYPTTESDRHLEMLEELTEEIEADAQDYEVEE